MLPSFLVMPSPLGPLTLYAARGALTALRFGAAEDDGAQADPILYEAKAQLDAYFAGRRFSFDLPLAPEGTAFQKRVWDALREIPCGSTRSYGELAQAVGAPKAFRAVGQANHANPLPILIPCHRVVRADGTLGGYAGGADRKRFLLALERAADR